VRSSFWQYVATIAMMLMVAPGLVAGAAAAGNRPDVMGSSSIGISGRKGIALRLIAGVRGKPNIWYCRGGFGGIFRARTVGFIGRDI